MRFFAVLNPAARGGRAGRLAGPLFESLRARGIELEISHTEHPLHATDLVKNAVARGHRRILAVGGDGTTFEVLNGLFLPGGPESTDVTLGIVPVGTGNSFLRDFGIRTPSEAVDAIAAGRERRVDVIRATHRDGELHYLNLLGLGFPADVASLTNARFKRLGAAGYVAAVLSKVASLRPISVPLRCDDGPWEKDPCTLVSFSNSRFTAGGMMMAPDADVSDGLLDMIRVDSIPRGTLVRAFPSIFRGTHVHRSDVSSRRAAVVELELPTLDAMIDGEVLSLKLHKLAVLPSALTLLA